MVSVLVIRPDDSVDYDRTMVNEKIDKIIASYKPDEAKEIKYLDYNSLKSYGTNHIEVLSSMWRQLLSNEDNLICVVRTKKTYDIFSMVTDLGELEHLNAFASNFVVREVVDYEH